MGVIRFSKDSGIKRYGCLAPVLRIMARREQLRGHFRAVIKNLLEPARDDKADVSGDQGSPGRRYSPDRAYARVRNSEMQERRRDALQIERIAEESEGLTTRAQPQAPVQACKFASPYRP